jgi:hypothetical protein
MNDLEIEKVIRRAGYDVGWEKASADGTRAVYALRDGKRHTRSHSSLLALAEYLGRIERPVQFVEDKDALEKAISGHGAERNHFSVQRDACRVAVFGMYKYVQLVSVARSSSAMYEVRTDGYRRISKGNLPPAVVAAFSLD